MDASSTGPAPKLQASITGTHQRVTVASAAKEKLVLDLVEAFVSANIPLDKLDNPKLRYHSSVVTAACQLLLADYKRRTASLLPYILDAPRNAAEYAKACRGKLHFCRGKP